MWTTPCLASCATEAGVWAPSLLAGWWGGAEVGTTQPCAQRELPGEWALCLIPPQAPRPAFLPLLGRVCAPPPRPLVRSTVSGDQGVLSQHHFPCIYGHLCPSRLSPGGFSLVSRTSHSQT